jgi:hypothetical protein
MQLNMWRLRSRRRTRSGQALVELAMILPIMLVLFSSALDLGRLYYSQITINNAAKEGALQAAKTPTSFDSTRPCDKDTNKVICLVINETKDSLIAIAPSDVSLTCDPDCVSTPAIGDTVEVSVQAQFGLLSPVLAVFFGGQTIGIASSATAQLYVDPDPGGSATPTPTPDPTPIPEPTPTPDPDATPTPIPTPTPTPVCVTPVVTGDISINPGAGQSVRGGTGTLFTMTAPTVLDQPGCTFTYTWSFGDGASLPGASVTHRYVWKGNGHNKSYTVTLAISATLVEGAWTGSKDVVVNP